MNMAAAFGAGLRALRRDLRRLSGNGLFRHSEAATRSVPQLLGENGAVGDVASARFEKSTGEEVGIRGFSTRATCCEKESLNWKNRTTSSLSRVPVRYMCKDTEAEDEHTAKKSHEAKKQNEKEEDDEKKRVLDAALTYVPTLGWTEAAIAAGARDVKLSPSILGAFQRKEAALVEYFMDECLDDLVEAVEEQSEELEKLVLNERLARIMRMRLEMQAPYVSKWAQALSIQANPINLPVAMKQRAVLMDEIWHAAGDRSTDWDWYTKRAILGGVYTASEVYMLTDYSPGFRDTWTFMERRLVDAIDCRKTAKEAAQLAQAIGAGLGNTIASFLKQPRSGPS